MSKRLRISIIGCGGRVHKSTSLPLSHFKDKVDGQRVPEVQIIAKNRQTMMKIVFPISVEKMSEIILESLETSLLF